MTLQGDRERAGSALGNLISAIAVSLRAERIVAWLAERFGPIPDDEVVVYGSEWHGDGLPDACPECDADLEVARQPLTVGDLRRLGYDVRRRRQRKRRP